jgi:succinate dehydrogenase / fumarate reductase cytochrome b subunit
MSEAPGTADTSGAEREPNPNAPWVRKLHSLTGVLPLGLFVIYHAWQQAPIRAGRDPLLARLDQTSHGLAEALCVVLPLLMHAACAIWLSLHGDALRTGPLAGSGSPRPDVYASPAFRRFQAITGGATAVFLVLHLGGVWRPWLSHGRAFTAFGAMLDQTGTLLGAAAYVVGISATCVHWGQGLSAFLLRWWPQCSPLLARGVGTLMGLGSWLTFLNELAVYATGAPLM